MADITACLPTLIKNGLFAKSMAAFKKSLVCKSFRGWPYGVSGSLYEKDLAHIEGVVREGLTELEQRESFPIRHQHLESIQEDKALDMNEFDDEDDYDLDEDGMMAKTLEEIEEAEATNHPRPFQASVQTDSTQVLEQTRIFKMGKHSLLPNQTQVEYLPSSAAWEYWNRLCSVYESYFPETKLDSEVDLGHLIHLVSLKFEDLRNLQIANGEGEVPPVSPSTTMQHRLDRADRRFDEPLAPNVSLSIQKQGSLTEGRPAQQTVKDQYGESFRSENPNINQRQRNSNQTSHKSYQTSSKKPKPISHTMVSTFAGEPISKKLTFGKVQKKQGSPFRTEPAKQNKKRTGFYRNMAGLHAQNMKSKERDSLGKAPDLLGLAEEVKKRRNERRAQAISSALTQTLNCIPLGRDLDTLFQHGLQLCSGAGKQKQAGLQNTSSFQIYTLQDGSGSKLTPKLGRGEKQERREREWRTEGKSEGPQLGTGEHKWPVKASYVPVQRTPKPPNTWTATSTATTTIFPKGTRSPARTNHSALLLERKSLRGSGAAHRTQSPGEDRSKGERTDKLDRGRKGSLGRGGEGAPATRVRKKSLGRVVLAPEVQPSLDFLVPTQFRSSLITANFLKGTPHGGSTQLYHPGVQPPIPLIFKSVSSRSAEVKPASPARSARSGICCGTVWLRVQPLRSLRGVLRTSYSSYL